MDFNLSREHLMLRKLYRDFAENEVKPLAQSVDEEERFPEETVKKMAKLGMMGIYFPKEYGGAGSDVLAYAMAVEELSKVCGTTGVIVSAHTSLCCAPIFENGTEEQKRKYLPKLCAGEWLGAFGLTEPGAGTDAQGQQTTAVDQGDHWLLNGSKIFITNAGLADVLSSSPSPERCWINAAGAQRRFPPLLWKKDSPASPLESTRRKWASAAPPPVSLSLKTVLCPRKICWAPRARAFPSP